MSFQESAESLRARLHLGSLSTSQLVVAAILCAVVVSVCVMGVVLLVSNHSFEVAASAPDVADSSVAESEQAFASSQDVSDAGVLEAKTALYVHVSGCVAQPGVYALSSDARVDDAVKAAGGATQEANLNAINLARIVADGEQVYVPSKDEVASSSSLALGANAGSGVSAQANGTSVADAGGIVNINTAGIDELMTLDGVGEATAKKIIAERESGGPFAAPEDIKRVTGIGDKKYEALKDRICV